MSTGKKVIIGVVAVVVLGGAVAGNVWLKRTPGKPVTTEKILKRDLEAIVSASGKIQARTTVNIAADTMGRVTELAVDEGQTVKKGQFLMQIDPRNQQTAAERTNAGLSAARMQLEQLRNTVATARENLALSRENLRRTRELWAQQLTTRQALDTAESEVKVREASLRDAEQSLGTQEQRIRESAATVVSAQYELRKARIESPIDGLIVRRNIEEGETVVIGTMNNAGTVLLTIADMSVIEAEVEVDETDIPFVKIGQAAKVDDRRHPRQDVHRQGHRGRQQPDSGGRPAATTGPRHQLQGHGDDRRRGPERPARLHLHRRRHDRDAPESRRRADPGDRRSAS